VTVRYGDGLVVTAFTGGAIRLIARRSAFGSAPIRRISSTAPSLGGPRIAFERRGANSVTSATATITTAVRSTTTADLGSGALRSEGQRLRGWSRITSAMRSGAEEFVVGELLTLPA